MEGQLFQPPEPEPEGPVRVVPDDAPLAARLRPARLEDVVGQEHLLAPGTPLRVAIESGRPHSMVLYGPPGSGKTTLARLVATSADAAFEELSAVQAGKAEVNAVLQRARQRAGATVFFLDEIHRFNKAQQDALLPAVEEGLVTLIGATTENPYFEVNGALISRCRVYELQPLAAADVRALLDRAGADAEDAALDFLADRSGGDARTALGALELAASTSGRVTIKAAEQALQRRAIRYDKAGDQHYDYISAYIKSVRGSDPDAALYYLAVMLEGGEDPRYLARRLVIAASEDIGNADPQALPLATACAYAVEHVGMPEAQHALAQGTIYLALAPKSNAAYAAIGAARAYVREHGAGVPPTPLRTKAGGANVNLGRGVGYDYPHDHPQHVNRQEHLPAGAEQERFYWPDDQEAELAERNEEVRRLRGR
jgi:putative ATPase